MILDLANAEYIALVAAKFQAGELAPNATCAECGVTIDARARLAAEDVGHIMIQRTEGDPMTGTDQFLMVIGCEGYWHINPEAVGLPRGGWMTMDEQIG